MFYVNHFIYFFIIFYVDLYRTVSKSSAFLCRQFFVKYQYCIFVIGKSSLSKLVDYLAERIDKIKCKHGQNNTKFEMHRRYDLILFKCLLCNRNYQMFNENFEIDEICQYI